MVLGALHLVFLWLGDILLAYGVAGLVLLLLRPLRPRTASVVGVVMLGLLSALIMVTAGGDQAPSVDAAGLARLLDDYRSSFLEAAQARIEVYGLIGGVTSTLLSALMVVPLFLFGLAAGRSGLLEEPERYAHLLPRVQLFGFGLGGTATVAVNVAEWTGTLPDGVVDGVALLASPLLAAGYAATVLRLSRADAWFGPAGRIAASNYIGQSLITAILFTGLGFGLAEKVPVWGTLVIALAIYVTQLAGERLVDQTAPLRPGRVAPADGHLRDQAAFLRWNGRNRSARWGRAGVSVGSTAMMRSNLNALIARRILHTPTRYQNSRWTRQVTGSTSRIVT